MRFEAENFGYPIWVQGEIGSGAYANFEDAPLGLCQRSLAIGSQLAISHRQVDEMRNDTILIKSHRFDSGEYFANLIESHGLHTVRGRSGTPILMLRLHLWSPRQSVLQI